MRGYGLQTKESRLSFQTSQIERHTQNGYSKEVYRGLQILTKEENGHFILRIFRDDAGHPIVEEYYRGEERRTQKIADIKESYDLREKRKAEAKNSKTLTKAAQAAAAIRAELKAAFPTVKFSVTSENFSMGDSVSIGWTDGPTVAQVTDITAKYQYGSFNGMEDLYEYTNSRSDIPQAKYVKEGRSMSEATEAAIMETLTARFGAEYLAEMRDYDRSREVRDLFRGMDLTPASTEEESPNIAPLEVTPGTVQVIEYSDKALAVVGDTKPIKDQLKELGGRFNFRLTCGPGWIFPKTKLEALKTLLAA